MTVSPQNPGFPFAEAHSAGAQPFFAFADSRPPAAGEEGPGNFENLFAEFLSAPAAGAPAGPAEPGAVTAAGPRADSPGLDNSARVADNSARVADRPGKKPEGEGRAPEKAEKKQERSPAPGRDTPEETLNPWAPVFRAGYQTLPAEAGERAGSGEAPPARPGARKREAPAAGASEEAPAKSRAAPAAPAKTAPKAKEAEPPADTPAFTELPGGPEPELAEAPPLPAGESPRAAEAAEPGAAALVAGAAPALMPSPGEGLEAPRVSPAPARGEAKPEAEKPGASRAPEGREHNRRKVELRDYRERAAEGAVFGPPPASSGESAPEAPTEALPRDLISVDLNPRSAGERAAPSGGNSGAGAFEDVLARELRQNLNSDIVRHAQVILRDKGEGVIRLSLKPETLGNVKIRLELSENKIAGRIIVESGEALRAFEREIASLERSFRDSGYESADLSASLAQDQGSGGGREEGKAFYSPRFALGRALYDELEGTDPSFPLDAERDALPGNRRISVNMLV